MNLNCPVVFGLGLILSACGGTNQNAAREFSLNIPETSSPLQANALGNGLTAEYFDSPNFTGLVVKRIDPAVNFNWGNGSPTSSIAPDTFSTRHTGELVAPNTGTYTFFTTSDDGVRLNINNKLVINRPLA